MFKRIILQLSLLSLLGLGIGVQPAWAQQDVRVEAEVDSEIITLNEIARYTITVYGAKHVEEFALPPIYGFDVRYRGPETSVQIINGSYSSAKSFIFKLYPKEVGKFTIPSYNLEVNGQTYSTPAIEIDVISSVNQEQSKARSLKDKIFLVLKTPKSESYLNESLPVKILCFVSDLAFRAEQYPQIEGLGFATGDYEKAKQYQQLIGGIRYNIIEFNTVIYPTRLGEITIGPATLEGSLIYKGENNRRFGGGFNERFFERYFNTEERRPITLDSADVTLNVLPLPKEGQPDSFTGGVGKYEFSASIGPNEVNVGDPITLKMAMRGEGNIDAVQFPEIKEDDNFKVYEPQIKEENGTKWLERVIIPKHDQLTEVPAIAFSYFNAEIGQYTTITQGPFPIKVTALEEEQDLKIITTDQKTAVVLEPEEIGRDLAFIKDSLGALRRTGQSLHETWAYRIFMLVIFIAWLTSFLLFKRTHKLETDVVYARRMMAPKQAKKGLAAAKKWLVATKKEEFYDELFKTLQSYLGNKLHLSSGAVTFDAVAPKLEEKNVEKTVILNIKKVFEDCDAVRFASATITEQAMQNSLKNVEQIIDHLERRVS